MNFVEGVKKHSLKIQTSLSSILKVILVLSIANAIYFHLWHILSANILLLLLLFMPYFLRKKYRVELPREFEFVILLFVIATFFLGEVRGIIIQIFFGLAIGFIGFAMMIILYSNSKLKTNYFFIVLFAFSFSLALGVGVEMMKYYLKWYFDYSFSSGDYTHGMLSMTLVAVGALVASFLGYGYMKTHKGRTTNRILKRFIKSNPNLFVKHTDSPKEVLNLIKKGEYDKLEFKSTLRTNLHTGEFDRRVEYAVLKTITAFLNSEGGTLLVGVGDDGRIFGIEKDRFQNDDKFNLHFTNLIKKHIGKEYLPFLNFELVMIENKNILKVECLKSNKPVFLKTNKGEEFYIRIGPASVQISGAELIEYVENSKK